MLNQLRSRAYLLEKKHCLLWLLGELRLLDEMRLLCWELLRWLELLRSFWLHRWFAIGWCEDELPKKRWPYRFLMGIGRGKCGVGQLLVPGGCLMRKVVYFQVLKQKMSSKSSAMVSWYFT